MGILLYNTIVKDCEWTKWMWRKAMWTDNVVVIVSISRRDNIQSIRRVLAIQKMYSCWYASAQRCSSITIVPTFAPEEMMERTVINICIKRLQAIFSTTRWARYQHEYIFWIARIRFSDDRRCTWRRWFESVSPANSESIPNCSLCSSDTVASPLLSHSSPTPVSAKSPENTNNKTLSKCCRGFLLVWLCCHNVEQQQSNPYPPHTSLVQSPHCVLQ